MKKIIITSVIVLSAAIVATSGIKTTKHKEVKTPAISSISSIHNGSEMGSAD